MIFRSPSSLTIDFRRLIALLSRSFMYHPFR
jgi:hypothetical protein